MTSTTSGTHWRTSVWTETPSTSAGPHRLTSACPAYPSGISSNHTHTPTHTSLHILTHTRPHVHTHTTTHRLTVTHHRNLCTVYACMYTYKSFYRVNVIHTLCTYIT